MKRFTNDKLHEFVMKKFSLEYEDGEYGLFALNENFIKSPDNDIVRYLWDSKLKTKETAVEGERMNENIYTMRLHETIDMDIYIIIRVAGGWIYVTRGGDAPSSVFVSFNNEFMSNIK